MAAAWTIETGSGGAGSDFVGLGVHVIGSQPEVEDLEASPQQGHRPAEKRLGWNFSARCALARIKFLRSEIQSSRSTSDLAKMHKKYSCGGLGECAEDALP